MPKKISKTALNIRSINSYIQTVARLFGANSAEYEAVTIPLKGFAIRDIYVNGQSVIQLRNTKENRKKHQSIRAIKNKRKPAAVLKRKYEKKRREYQSQMQKANLHFDAGAFYKWYAEIRHEFDGLWDEIYNYLDPSCDLVGIDLDKHQAFANESYRMNRWETVYEKGGKNYVNLDDFFSNFESVNESGVDESSGENMTFTNGDYDIDMGFD